jgi:signal transduction histidine kinase
MASRTRREFGWLMGGGIVAGGFSQDAGLVVLLGDSVFDNKAYVGDGPDVVAQVREMLPRGWSATLAAVDGAVTGSVPAQLGRLPERATHLVVSVGGNDALRNMGLLEAPASSMADALERLAKVRDQFRADYARMLRTVLARGLPTATCTIYEGRIPDARTRRLALTALPLFNDIILREAFSRGLPVLDLREICDDDEDYANPIEPSVRGGAKIAAAIVRVATGHRFPFGRSEVFVR